MSVTNLPRFGAAVCITFGGRTVDNRRWSQILVENRDFCLPYLHLKPPLGGYRRNIAITFGVEKVEWCGYPMVKKSLRIILFSRVFDRIPACDTRTDRQTPRDGICRAYALHSIAPTKTTEHSMEIYIMHIWIFLFNILATSEEMHTTIKVALLRHCVEPASWRVYKRSDPAMKLIARKRSVTVWLLNRNHLFVHIDVTNKSVMAIRL